MLAHTSHLHRLGFSTHPAVPALAYHKVAEIPASARHRCNYVTPQQFRAQLQLLRVAGYNSISFAEYLAYRGGDAVLPPKPILITFDDGYRSNLDFALPALAEAGYTATVFVVSGLIGRANLWDADEIQEPLLSGTELREIRKYGHDVQSHTRTHPNLTKLADRAAIDELLGSRLELQDLTGAPVRVIAYPWGAANARVQRLAARAGYEAGVILRRRVNRTTTPPLELRRIGINCETTLARFAWDLARLRFRGE